MKHPLKWDRRRVFWGINAVLAVLCALCLLLQAQVIHTLPTLNAAHTWRGENELRFAQIACYLPQDGLLQESEIFSFRQTLSSKLMAASLEAPQGGALYTDAYYGQGSVTVKSSRGVSAKANALGVAGDFFRFHPLELRSGNYLADSDLMKDRVLLDETLAWTLFGGMELTGLSVTIGTKDYYVAGVVRLEDDKYSTLANKSTGGNIFLSYSALKELEGDSLGVAGYEIVLPDPITDFGKNLVKDNLRTEGAEIVENSGRYTLARLWQVARDFGKRSMGRSGILFPYWENALRMTEDLAALDLVLALLFGALPAVSLLVLAIRTVIRLLKKLRSGLASKVAADVEKKREKRWEKARETRED